MQLEEVKEIQNLKSKYNDLIREANQLKKVRTESIGSHYTQMRTISDFNHFFKECIQAGTKQVFKEYSHNKELLQELKKKYNKDPIKKSSNRNTKVLVYDIVKEIVAVNKEQAKNEYLSHIKMDWNTFKEIRALDILGLLLLKKEVLDKVCGSMFNYPLSKK